MDDPTPDEPQSESPTLAKIKSGAYKVPKLEARPPALPVLLRKSLLEMEEDELEQALEERAAYQAARLEYKVLVEEHATMADLMLEQLRSDLQAEFEVPDGEKATRLFEICREYAKGELNFLYGFYDDLNLLVK